MLVRVRNPEFGRDIWRFTQPEFFEYTGDEVRLKHISADELALTTGIAEFPIRVIQRRYIVSIDGQTITPTSSKNPTRIVRGSKGEEYVVANGSCTCPGFQFRRTCRHLNM
jgi:hypothetical protein